MGTYRFPATFLAARMLDVLRRRPAPPFAVEMRPAFERYRSAVVIQGQEHLPRTGAFIIAANHYQRPGLGAEWIAIGISIAVSDAIPGADLRWMHQDGGDGYRLLDRVPVPPPVARRFLGWISRRYGFLPVVVDDAGGRAPMLREAYRLLHRDAIPIAIMPEGANATPNGELAPVREGAGPALAWLSAGEIPIVPVAVHETDDARLTIAFLPAVVPERRSAQDGRSSVADDLMRRIAGVLPAPLRGPYGEAAR